MPIRKTSLVPGQYYHVYNRGVEKRPIFLDKRDYRRALNTLDFYRFSNLPTKLSKFLLMSNTDMLEFKKNLQNKFQKQVEIIAYSLMPNHFHLLLQQLSENGISEFIKIFSDSYIKFFNIKYERVGPLFQGQFKAVLVESDEQLLHVSRYIHLNPYTSYLVKTYDQLIKYPWSSLEEYVSFNNISNLCKNDIILNNFSSKEEYLKYVVDQAEYQRSLDSINHLIIE